MLINDHIKRIIKSEHWDPFSVLGMHYVDENNKKGIVVRAFIPDADETWIVEEENKKTYKAEKIDKTGFFEKRFEGKKKFFRYKLKIRTLDNKTSEFYDPYSFLPILSDFDLHLIGEGNHYKAYEKLGAHVMKINGIKGVHFAVWAPNAKRISIVGGFNNWNGKRHQMRVLGSSGIWELFIPGLNEGELYKFEIKTKLNDIILKSDPYAFYSEYRPKTASIVHDINKYKWNDTEWISKRSNKNLLEAPISAYEVHLGSWMRVPDEKNRFLTYRELADKLIPYVKNMGYTHIELLPIMEHPFDASWGYQVIGYFAPTSRHGSPEDFMYFVDRCHQNNIGLILDWVPAHFPKDSHGLANFDGTALYEHRDPRKAEHKDWGTLIFNYGRNEVKNFLISNALFWIEKYHIDGLRVDAVASMIYLDYSKEEGEWLPNIFGGRENLEAIDFIKKFNEVMHFNHPGILTIAEESTAWSGVSRPTYLGGLGFSLKWNMGWMHDTLEYFSKEAVYRKYHQHNLTFGLLYAFTENFMLVLSHDEVVYEKCSMLNKMPGDTWQKFANLRLIYGFMFGHPGKKLLFMGNDIGQWDEWNFDKSIDWHLLEYESHRSLQKYVKDLNKFYKLEASLYEVDFVHNGFEWIDFHDTEQSIISFIRKAKNSENFLLFVCNFTPVPRTDYRIGVPADGIYKEVFNTDNSEYGGSNMLNGGIIKTENKQYHGREYSISITIPPLALSVFKMA
ncbi:MAG: 1,4-alpha-glucan branching protein GlgB [Nitrospiraceae bacterium]|nr:1,4-alpha-glucan branching protein GlgB [Nitrospiraceae bacterium]